MVDNGVMEATATERQALQDLYKILDEAKGDHPALSDVRRLTCEQIDAMLGVLASAGVNTDALLDEMEAA